MIPASHESYTRIFHVSTSWHSISGANRVGLRQFHERLPHPLACRRKHRKAALALPKLRTTAHLVGKRSRRKLDCADRALPDMQRKD